MRRESGAAAVELALILPFIALLTFGIIESSRAWNVRAGLDHAAREAARFGAVQEDQPGWGADVAQKAQDNLEGVLVDGTTPGVVTYCAELVDDLGASSPNGSDCAVPDGANTDARVEVRLTTDLDLNFLVFQRTVRVTSDAVARYER